MKAGSGVAVLKLEIYLVHKEHKLSTASVAKSEGVAARAHEEVAKVEAENVKFREEAK